MKKIVLILIVCLNASMACAATIATGPSDGSYFQIAQDIKNVAGKDGIDIQVMPTKGSVENIELLSAGKTDLAIVQLDALRFVSDVLKQKQGLDLFDNIKIIMNLYPEEIHVLTNKKDIQSFYQLDGKRISVGTEGGGTCRLVSNANAFLGGFRMWELAPVASVTLPREPRGDQARQVKGSRT
jgi:TRAP transporter TAXI family solute receptor